MPEINKKIIPNIRDIFFILFFIFSTIQGLEKIIYKRFNDMITISINQQFSISPDEDSILYFDSIDKNSIVYLKDGDGNIIQRIDGEFFDVKAYENYIVDVNLYSSEFPSILIRYLLPYNLGKQILMIKDNNNICLYLIKHQSFELNFRENSIKKVFSLSRKTLKSNVVISHDTKQLFELNEKKFYYEIPDNFKDTLTLEITGEDAFIKLLSVPEEKDEHIYIMAKTSFSKYKIGFKTSTLFIPYTQKQIEIQLYSNESFKYSFSGGFASNTPSSWYYYNSTENHQILPSKTDKNIYSVTIKFPNIYKDIKLTNPEYFTFSIGVNYDKTKFIYLNYRQYSDIDDLLDE